ncbi:capsule assembly Wzi family protein [Mangrovibacterium diazotrophicum]|uniref:Capsule assembly protein Wzi n=1 Tax=Mangrovibacterium diazotrophicum TaxID=1261403 RepID=A0A419W5R2_9BACT|nr:capsule assembly Wzi family protein [Mangrovibacterium diazotrophicum]RKD90784.1 capsule assembly protein Wzi [Mangrovibacterium diazotrophicum]
MKRTLPFLFVLSLFSLTAFSQLSEVSVSATTLGKKGSEVPFWFTHNQFGKYEQQVRSQFQTEVDYSGIYPIDQNFNVVTGVDCAVSYDAYSSRFMIIQGYAGLSNRLAIFRIGAFANDIEFDNLSTSNGDIVSSVNYRPIPKISLTSNDFIPSPVWKKYFSFKFAYEEGFLENDRYIRNAMLHHDQLYIRYRASQKLTVTAGVNRYIFWGGTQPDGEQLPSDFKSYVRYLTGRSGDSQFLQTDRDNVAGNQLGSYLLSLRHSFKAWDAEFRMTHPFEDHSGMEFDNWRDNLITLFINRKKKGRPVDALLFEFMYTKDQSGDRHQLTGPRSQRMRGLDNYFNHGVYKSGFVYKDYSMGTPLFTPIIYPMSSGKGFANNRVVAWHVGANGYILANLSWRTLITYTRNFGTYSRRLEPYRYQWYTMGELNWLIPEQKFTITGLAGIDYGDLSGKKLGLGLTLKKDF